MCRPLTPHHPHPPPTTPPHPRERFLELLCGASGGFVVEECGERCARGAPAGSPLLQFLVLRRTLPGDTVGLKPRSGQAAYQ